MTKNNSIRKGLNVLFLTLIFFATSRVGAQTIATIGVAGTSFCAGDATTVSYSVTGSFSVGNTFTAQLSDETGSFAAPINIGSVVSTTSGNISVVFPLSSTSSYIYRIRVVADNPSIVGTDNGNNLNINPIPSASAGPDQLLCGNSTVTLAGSVGLVAPFANWSSTGTGTFNNTSNLNAEYTPSAADVLNGSVILILTTNDPAGPCVAAKDSMTVSFLQAPIVSAGTTQNLCVNTTSVNLSGSISGTATSATWSTLGSGSFNNNSLLNAVYTPSANDISAGFVKLVLTTNDPAGPCTLNRDTVRINFNPLAVSNAGIDQTICAGNNVSLSATTNATGGSKIWTSSGTGFFDNNAILTPNYFPSTADIQNGSVTFTFTTSNPSFVCDNSSDNVLVNINQLPGVDAGVDFTVCESSNSVGLNGSLSGSASSGTWSTQGTGTFNNINSLNAVYTPSVADKAVGFVNLFLTTNDPIGPCGATQDMVKISFNQAATTNAGIDQLICSNTAINATATLGGSATFGSWTSSSNPSYISFSNPVSYLPTATDIANGKVVLTFTTNDPFGPCSAVKDSLEVTINQAVVVNAGNDQILCNDATTVSLLGSFGSGASSATWSTTGTGSFNNVNLANAIYTPSVNDKNSGLVKLVYTTNDPAGPCNAETDTVYIQFVPYTTVANAGPDQQRCTNDSVILAASANITGNVTWTSNGTGLFNNNSSLTPTYYPSNADVLNGSVILTFSIINPSIPCSFASDNLLVTFNQLPTANAGLDQTVCENDLSVSLSGSVSGTASTGTWSTQGTGTFDNVNSLNALYFPSVADKAAGFVNLVLTTNDPVGPCGATNDIVRINFNPVATVDAGINQNICSNKAINISAVLGGSANFGSWTSSSNPAYISFNNPTTYSPTNDEIANGKVVLTFTTNDPFGPCSAAKDSVEIVINNAVTVSAGNDQILCNDATTVSLLGSFGSGASSATWSTTGTGTFNNVNLANAIYTPSVNDKNNGLVKLVYTTNDPTGPCTAESDTVNIQFVPYNTIANAGIDRTICVNDTVNLSASANISGNVTWTSSGTGIFNNNSSLTPTYFPSNADVLNGNVTLTFSIINPSIPCSFGSDNMVITFNQLPSVNAGLDQTVCENDASINLNGTIGGSATSATWSTQGTGTFNNINSLNALYFPSTADKLNGFVNLVLTTNDPAGPCGPNQDIVTINFNPAATVNAGLDQTVCSNSVINATANLGGSANFGSWTSSTNSNFIAFSNSANYIPTANEIANGKVVLTFTTNDPFGPCSAAKDSVEIFINNAVTVNAGNDQILCNDATNVSLLGSFGNGATNATWSTTGTGTFNNINLANAIYTPSVNDKNNGLVKLVFTTNDPTGPCTAESDTLNIQFVPYNTIANAGIDRTICANDTVNLSASANISGNVTWTSSGTGIFNNNSSLTPTYYPSNADILNGNVTLTFSIINPSIRCSFGSDNMVVVFNQIPTVNAGTDIVVCESNTTVNLAGAIGGSASFGTWLTKGSGTFNNLSDLSAIYTPSVADKSNGFVDLTLTTNDPAGPCGPVEDIVRIVFNPAARVDLGPDQNICSNKTVAINASLGGSATIGSWTSSTNPGFISFSNPIDYAPTSSEIANGKVVLTYTTNDPFGPCSVVKDSVEVLIEQGAIVNAGVDQSICVKNSKVILSGFIGGLATEANWSTTGTGTFDDLRNPNATYFPSNDDVKKGSILLILTTNDPDGNCEAITDTLELRILPFSTVADAGTDRIICATETVKLSASANIVGTVSWTTSGTGVFDNSSSLTPTYFPSNGDVINGNVILTFTIENPTIPCSFASDNLIVTINQLPTVNAGTDITVCETNTTVSLKGSVGGTASSGKWSTLGTGTFNNVNIINPIYTPSTVDKNRGFVDLILNTNDPAGPCVATADTVRIVFNPAPIVDAGLNQNICENQSVNLTALLGGSANIGSWTSSTNIDFISFTNPLTYFPTATEIANGRAVLTFTTNDPFGPCSATKDSVEVVINKGAQVNAGLDQTICVRTPNVALSGLIGGTATSAIWSTLGTGNFDNVNNLNTNYFPSNNDISNGSVLLVLTTNNPGGVCTPKSDTVEITILPFLTVANAGPDQLVCSVDSVKLSASANIAGIINWATSGTGAFSNSSSLNPTYYLSNADKNSGSIILTFTIDNPSIPCSFASDNLVININPQPIANAGSDQTICANNNQVNLNGLIGGSASVGSWTTLGTGTFNNANDLNAIYTPAQTDKDAGFVNLVLTSIDPSGFCAATQDIVRINFNPAATVNAGLDQTVCSNSVINVTANLGGSANFGSWTSSTNSNFIAFSNSANYIPTANEIANGKVVLTFTTNDPFGPCSAAKDSVEIFINNAVTVNAGNDQILCNDATTVSLLGSFGNGASSATWSTTGTGTFNNINLVNAIYTPSANDKNNGLVKLVYTTNNPTGPCTAESDTVNIQFVPYNTIANAGIDRTICANDTINLSASANISGNVTWTTSGTGIFNNNSSLTPTYYPSNADILNGNVTLTFSIVNPSIPCSFASDNVLINFNQLPLVDAGTDINVCESNTAINLSGSVGGSASTGTWSTLGSGTFNNSNNLNAIYTPSIADRTTGFVNLVLTTNDPAGPCGPIQDIVKITFDQSATVNAGLDQVICSNGTINVAATTGGAASFGSWTSSTNSSFISFNSSTSYTPNALEYANGKVVLTFKTNDPFGACDAAVDSVQIFINQIPLVDAGADQTVCSNISTVTLSGLIGGSATSSYWKTTGTGTFNDSNLLGAIYTPSVADKASGLTKLILITNDPAGPCVSVNDTLELIYRPFATANVGVDKTICAADNILLGVTTNVTGNTGFWSTTGNGGFSNNTSLTPTYFPSEADIAAGSIKIAYTNFDANDVCANVTDTLVLNINQPVQVTAGMDQTVCANATSIALTGTISGAASSCFWNTTGIGSFVNRLNDTATYIPSASDKSRGFVNLVLSTNDPVGPCPLKRDTVTIVLSPVAVVNAGPDQNICGNSPVNFFGSYNSVAVFAKWTNTSVPAFNSYDSIFTYNPTAADIANGQMTFILTSSDPVGPCPAVVDSVNVKFYQPVTTNAGADQVLCATANSIDLSGSFGGGAASILWVTTNGTGTFDDPTALNTVYRPSAADLAAKSIQISITTDDPIGPCFAGFDDIAVQFKDSLVSFATETVLATCDSTIVRFINTTTSLGNNYLWDFGDSETSSNANPIHAYKKVGIFDVKLKASSANGCLENVASQVIVNSIKPAAIFNVNKFTQCLIDNGFDFSNSSQGGTVSWITSVLWDFGDATTSTSTFPSTKRYAQAGDYRVQLSVLASNGCFDTISKVITINPGPKKPVITLTAGNTLKVTQGVYYQWFLNGTPISGANSDTYVTTGYGFYSVRVDSTNGCGTMSDDFELKYNSINERQNLINSVHIYPNPNNGIVNIDADQNLNFTVYDVSGKEILSGAKVQKIHQIDLMDYSSGIYFLKLYNDKDQFTTKIIRN